MWIEERSVPGAGHVVVAACVRTFGHVRDCGSNMAVGPESPVEIHLGAGSSFSVKRCRLRANNAALCVATTLQIGQGYILYWTIALNGTRDALRSRVHVGILIWLVEGVRLVANGSIVHVAVTGHSGGESESSGDVLHRGRSREDCLV